MSTTAALLPPDTVRHVLACFQTCFRFDGWGDSLAAATSVHHDVC